MRVLPVPLDRGGRWAGGCNQAALIARALGASVEVPVELELLRRVKRTPALRGLNPSQRAKTVSGAFRIEPKDRARFTGKTVLLIDDVYTSGATANGCAREIGRSVV